MDYGRAAANIVSEIIVRKGLTPPSEVIPGKLHQFPGLHKIKNEMPAWCLLLEDSGGAFIGDFSTGLSVFVDLNNQRKAFQFLKPYSEMGKAAMLATGDMEQYLAYASLGKIKIAHFLYELSFQKLITEQIQIDKFRNTLGPSSSAPETTIPPTGAKNVMQLPSRGLQNIPIFNPSVALINHIEMDAKGLRLPENMSANGNFIPVSLLLGGFAGSDILVCDTWEQGAKLVSQHPASLVLAAGTTKNALPVAVMAKAYNKMERISAIPIIRQAIARSRSESVGKEESKTEIRDAVTLCKWLAKRYLDYQPLEYVSVYSDDDTAVIQIPK